MTIIGIDLGTSNSLVSVWRDTGVELIPNGLGEVLTPSVVSIDEDGSLLVGQAAKERLISAPDKTAAEFNSLDCRNCKYCTGYHVLHSIEHGIAHPCRKPYRRALN